MDDPAARDFFLWLRDVRGDFPPEGWEAEGHLAARAQHGSPDALADRLFDWLRERGEHPPEGWETKLRRDFRGDEVAAIRKFLDLAAQFDRLPRADGAA